MGIATSTARKTAWARQKRARVKDLGLCITCCKQCPENGRSVCKPCAESATRRKKRRNAGVHERKLLQNIIQAHERAGDVAHQHHLYEDAAQHYQDAVNVQAIAPSERSRISEKLAYALALGRNPQAADPLFDHALERYTDEPADAAKIVEILLQRARHLWRSVRTADAILLLTHAIEVAEADGTPHLCMLAKSRMADYLIGLERYEEAAALVDAVSGMLDESDAASSATYYAQKGMLAGERGDATECFRYFDLALNAVKADPDIMNRANVWDSYATWAISLADIKVSYRCCERGLLLAREYHIGSKIPSFLLIQASQFMMMGQYGTAHEYLLEALSYSRSYPRREIAFAWHGIRIALHAKDEETIARCAIPSALELAFRSNEPETITDTAAAFVEWHYAYGRERQAQELIHRVIETVENPYRLWLFPIVAAQFGAEEDIPQARTFFKRRLSLPCADVALACLALFEAYVAQRNGQQAELQEYARDAVKQFTLLGWHGYADMAHALLPDARGALDALRERKPFSDTLGLLTARERQIAELVFKKYTNRAIAEMLAISERTVETHMTSIMHRLGVRSRYQLDRLV